MLKESNTFDRVQKERMMKIAGLLNEAEDEDWEDLDLDSLDNDLGDGDEEGVDEPSPEEKRRAAINYTKNISAIRNLQGKVSDQVLNDLVAFVSAQAPVEEPADAYHVGGSGPNHRPRVDAETPKPSKAVFDPEIDDTEYEPETPVDVTARGQDTIGAPAGKYDSPSEKARKAAERTRMSREDFEHILDTLKKHYGVKDEKDLPPEVLAKVRAEYDKRSKTNGREQAAKEKLQRTNKHLSTWVVEHPGYFNQFYSGVRVNVGWIELLNKLKDEMFNDLSPEAQQRFIKLVSDADKSPERLIGSLTRAGLYPGEDTGKMGRTGKTGDSRYGYEGIVHKYKRR